MKSFVEIMQAFLIGLQFLTRAKLVRRKYTWRDEDFRSFRRLFSALVADLIVRLALGSRILCRAFLHVAVFVGGDGCLAEFILTGSLHADRFMDTCDGYFSGRERARVWKS